MTPELKSHIASLLSARRPLAYQSIGGGSINEAWMIDAGEEKFFCKVNSNTRYPGLFTREAAGLDSLRKTRTIQCPDVISVSTLEDHQILLMEWVESARIKAFDWVLFGEQLAKLHLWKDAHHPETRFGFDHDNYMGSLPQCNKYTSDWCTFFRERRLAPQIKMASERALLSRSHVTSFENLYKKLPEIFPSVTPSLVHGDLWNGNFLFNQNNEPVVFDPAVYYGIGSIDLAMTTLFGGFHELFYEVYEYWSPLPANHEEQWQVCNLYPLLIHLNLFGNQYLSGIESCLHRFD